MNKYKKYIALGIVLLLFVGCFFIAGEKPEKKIGEIEISILNVTNGQTVYSSLYLLFEVEEENDKIENIFVSVNQNDYENAVQTKNFWSKKIDITANESVSVDYYGVSEKGLVTETQSVVLYGAEEILTKDGFDSFDNPYIVTYRENSEFELPLALLDSPGDNTISVYYNKKEAVSVDDNVFAVEDLKSGANLITLKYYRGDELLGENAIGAVIYRQIIPLSVDDWVDAGLDWLTERFSKSTKGISAVIAAGIKAVIALLEFIPVWLLIILFTGLAYWLGKTKIAIFTFVGFVFIWATGLWDPMLSTLALVLLSTLLSVMIGIPLGILSALNETARGIITPILDFMQTLPAFVYLIPAIPFFGLGEVSAIFATLIFAIPPSIRLTSLGIRQIPLELIEASDSFGATNAQKLFKVQLPLAVPTIMAGVNQTIMLSLSMVVIAAMIGAGGLGGEVWKAIQRMKSGQGFVAGLGVVIVAMVLDRMTQQITKRSAKHQHVKK